MATRKKGKTRKKNSLVANINARKKKGTSRPRTRSTVSSESYSEMRAGWPHSKKARKKKRTVRKKTARLGRKKR